MYRQVLFIPLDEIREQFQANARQSVKLIAPQILTDTLLDMLRARGKQPKPERLFEGDVWRAATASEPNNLSEASEFIDRHLPQYTEGPFALSIATELIEQDRHFHRQHLEIYFSEHPIAAEYKKLGDVTNQVIDMPGGGALIFGPEVVHKMTLGGLTLVIEIPAMADDTFSL